MSEPATKTGRLRLLVAIACFGTKNVELLKRIIDRYHRMSLEVDVVVLSDAPKDFGPRVKVLVGMPTEDPWSLPFAHKSVLAENADRHDLFAYSEDDMEITEENIQAFLRLTPQLDPSEIAGYLRYEVTDSGEWSMPDIHAYYRWKPESVVRRGPHTLAEFTNEHAAFYLLTRAQLKRAIASGGFLRETCEGRHDKACTAATDPYTNCGFHKVVCVSGIEDFLIHHMSNRYAGRLGISLKVFKEQIQTLVAISRGEHPASTLCPVESRLRRGRWSKSLYEEPNEELLKLIPKQAKTILSIGCGWGAAEARLQERGARVTVLPMDSVIGAGVERLGMEVIYGSLQQSLAELAGRKFDCVFVTNLLHLMPNPEVMLEQCAGVVAEGGTLLIAGPHLKSLRVQLKRMLGKLDFRKLAAHNEGGVSVFGPGTLGRWLKQSGFRASDVRFFKVAAVNGTAAQPPRDEIGGPLRSLSATEWILQSSR